MKPSERRRQLMEVLLQSGKVHLPQLVQLLQVSEGTIRNDLRVLENKGELIRTHGGAVIGKRAAAQHPEPLGAQSEPDPQMLAIRGIAKRAAALVEEGDIIFLAGGTITNEIATELLPLKTLTVVTNSVHAATILARNPTQTVVLTGGQLRNERDSLDGHPAVSMLGELRVQKAFLSCDGISAERGFTDNDIAGSELKAAVFRCARKVIVAATVEQLGKSALVSIAPLSSAQHIITSDKAPEVTLNAIRAAGVQVSLCGEHITELYADRKHSNRWRIGFANLTEKQEFAVTVRQSIEQAACENGEVDLLLTDNEADPAIALANARGLVDAHVDLVIEYQQDEQTNNVLMDLFRSAHIPVMAIDIPLPGATFIGADNYRAGRIGGNAAADWVKDYWSGNLDFVICLEQPESGPVPASRIQGQIDALRAAIPIADNQIMRLSTRGDMAGSQVTATQALADVPGGKNVLFFGINANSALGALAAAETLDRQKYVGVVSQNASARIRRQLLLRNPMLIGAVDYFPQDYGKKAIQIALSILNGRPTPPAVYTNHVLVTPENIISIYPDDFREKHQLLTPTGAQTVQSPHLVIV